MKRNKHVFLAFLIVTLATINIAAQYIDLSAKGKLIAEGKNTTSVEGDDFKLTSYRLEIIPEPTTYPKSPIRQTASYKAVRLVLTGEFKTGSYIIWLNGAPSYVPSGNGNELHLIKIGDRVLFQDGLEIAVSRYGLKERRVNLPEPFVVPDEFKTPSLNQKKFEENMTLSYRPCSYTKPEPDEKCVIVRIYVTVDMIPGGMNAGWYLQIGGEEFEGAMNVFIIPWKQFELLKDGDWMVIKRERGLFGGVGVGKLKKSLLKEDKSFFRAP